MQDGPAVVARLAVAHCTKPPLPSGIHGGLRNLQGFTRKAFCSC
jgi:hypothetical protein